MRLNGALSRRRRQRAGDELVMIVDARGDSVNRADERPLAAADHSQSDPPPFPCVAASLDRHARVSSVARSKPALDLISDWVIVRRAALVGPFFRWPGAKSLCKRPLARGAEPSVENSRRQDPARRPPSATGTPKREAAQNLEFAAGFAFPNSVSASTRSAREGTRSLNSQSSKRATRSASTMALVKAKCG